LYHPLGGVVHVVLHVLIALIEQLMLGDAIRPVDVPVGLLGLRLQVDAVGQSGVEQLDHLDAVYVTEQPPIDGDAVGGDAPTPVRDQRTDLVAAQPELSLRHRCALLRRTHKLSGARFVARPLQRQTVSKPLFCSMWTLQAFDFIRPHFWKIDF
jgi:hypothetical protein